MSADYNSRQYNLRGPHLPKDRQAAAQSIRASNRGKSRDFSRTNNIYNVLQTDVSEPESSGKPIKIPPVTALGVDILSLKTLLASTDGLKADSIKFKLTEKGIKIFTNTNKEHALVFKTCTDNNLECFTHTLEEEKKTKICLYGLWKMEPDLVLDELKKLKIKAADVKLLKPKNERNSARSIYIVFFDKKDDVKLDYLNESANELFSLQVKWQLYINTQYKPTQCSRCLDFGHGSLRCRRPFKCICCAGNHESAICNHLPRDQDNKPLLDQKIDQTKVSCVNCTQNHTANYGGCPYRKNYVSYRKFPAAQEKWVPARAPPSKLQNKTVPKLNLNSFTDFPDNLTASSQNASASTSAWNTLAQQKPKKLQSGKPNTAADLFSIETCMEILDEFLLRMSSVNSKQEQIRAIAEVAFKFCCQGQQDEP